MKTQRAIIAVPVLATLALLSACTTGTAPEGADGSPSTTEIRTAFVSDVGTFDPALGKQAADFSVARLLYDTVVRMDDDHTVVDGIATEWVTTPTSVDLTIRTDATCSDGTAITAQTVADSLARFADPATGSSFAQLVFGPGAPTITASGELVSITLAQPWSEVLNGLALAQTGIVCGPGLADPAGTAAGDVAGAFSGPYVLGEVQRGVSYKFELRDDYDAWPVRAAEAVGVPARTITASFIDSPTTIANQLQTGQLDLASIAGQDVKRFVDETGFSTTAFPHSGLFIMFNQREGSVFRDAPELRQAVAQAVAPEGFNALVNVVGTELPRSFASMNTQCVNTDASLLTDVDPVAAAALLNGVTLRQVGATAIGTNGSGNEYVAEALRASGAIVDLRNLPAAEWFGALVTDPTGWDFTVLADNNAIGTLIGPITRISGTLIQDGGRNFGGDENAEIQAALAEALAAEDDASKCAAYQSAQKIALTEHDVVPLATWHWTAIARDGFAVNTYSGVVDEAMWRIVD